ENLLKAPYIRSGSAGRDALLALQERERMLNDLNALYSKKGKEKEKAEEDMAQIIKEMKKRSEEKQKTAQAYPAMPHGAQASERIMSNYKNSLLKQSQN
ncbi:MAG: hypothetical protein KAR23_03105, partial [Candidatus Aenigmarchaeota archaeon]|nr:hypothetical protein [Candidatus Aenigmarchaeota archaeon]